MLDKVEQVYKSFPGLAYLSSDDKEELYDLLQGAFHGAPTLIRFEEWVWTTDKGWTDARKGE